MNCYTYKCLLQAFLRSYESTKAFDTYLEMRRRGYKLDIFGYNMLLDALAKDEKVWNLNEWIEYMTLSLHSRLNSMWVFEGF